MIDKDPLSYSYLTYAWVFGLSIMGGVVSFFRKVRLGRSRALNVTEFIGEIVTSAFSGVLTFWLCENADISPLMTAAMVGVSGHMGSRLILQLEIWIQEKFPISHD